MDALQVLAEAGAPLPGARRGGPREPERVRRALSTLREGGPSVSAHEAVGAWLLGWHQHWPKDFHRTFGAEVSEVLDWAAAARRDADRFLKLRRIALANLG